MWRKAIKQCRWEVEKNFTCKRSSSAAPKFNKFESNSVKVEGRSNVEGNKSTRKLTDHRKTKLHRAWKLSFAQQINDEIIYENCSWIIRVVSALHGSMSQDEKKTCKEEHKRTAEEMKFVHSSCCYLRSLISQLKLKVNGHSSQDSHRRILRMLLETPVANCCQWVFTRSRIAVADGGGSTRDTSLIASA